SRFTRTSAQSDPKASARTISRYPAKWSGFLRGPETRSGDWMAAPITICARAETKSTPRKSRLRGREDRRLAVETKSPAYARTNRIAPRVSVGAMGILGGGAGSPGREG